VVKCWASALGGCSHIQSREHYVSRALFQGDSITVKGLWTEEKTVGIDALTAKNLCKTHNEILSPLDAAASELFQTINELYRLQETRQKLKPQKFWNVKRYRASGPLFERWAAKFVVGSFYVLGKNQHWQLTGTGPLEPPRQIFEAIFGIGQFQKPMGLYLAFDVGDRHYYDDGVKIATLFHPDDHGLVGANIDFKGFRFVMWLGGDELSTFNIPTDAGRIFGPAGSELMYHPGDARFAMKKVLSQVLTFEW
jgi:hypothetical protein